MSTTDLAARYGAKPAWQRRAPWVLGGVLVVATVAFVVAFLPRLADPKVSSGVFTPTIVDDRTATATFTVKVQEDVTGATCTVKAYAVDHTLVGTLTFPVTGSGRVEQTIATERRADALELVGCTAPGQNRPR